MMNPLSKLLAGSVLLVAFALAGCSESDRDTDTTIRSAADFTTANNVYIDLFKQVHSVAVKDLVLSSPSDTLPTDGCLDTVSLTPPTGPFPIQVGIDYGNAGATCNDNRVRTGLVSASFSDRWIDSAAVVTVSAQGYNVSGFNVGGTMTVTNRYWDGGDMVFGVTIAGGEVSNDTVSIELDMDYTFRWIEGINTTTPTDDVFEVSGDGDGRNDKGNDFTVEVSPPFRVTGDCRWLYSGTARVKPDNLAQRSVIYGNQLCDRTVIILIHGTQREYMVAVD